MSRCKSSRNNSNKEREIDNKKNSHKIIRSIIKHKVEIFFVEKRRKKSGKLDGNFFFGISIIIESFYLNSYTSPFCQIIFRWMIPCKPALLHGLPS